MTFGSLFSGIGGMDLGLERAGMECRWQVEIDDYCRKVLAKHWPNVRRYGDIREVTGAELEPVDLIAGGFPCQPFSTASHGRRRGTDDARWLWPDMRHIISESEPTWIFGENVAGFNGPGLEQMVAEMEADGYEVAPPLSIPACAFGRDHRRTRLWILAYADARGKPGGQINAEAQMLSRFGNDARSMGRTHGISKGMDRTRMKALGNAVVPQVSEWIGRRILEAFNG